MFNNKTLLITGGTGSFGNAVLRRFLQSNLKEIRIFSRDEKKQDDMRKRYASPKLKFYIGDVRDSRCVAAAMRGVDYVFHAAALKQVPSCEFHPMEAVRTNVLGTENFLEAAIAAGVKRVAIEAGVADGWYKYVGLEGAVIGLHRFGESAPAGALFKEFGFTVEHVVATVKGLI
jgi:nucleoside-diphosphate-sugar epimerase